MNAAVLFVLAAAHHHSSRGLTRSQRRPVRTVSAAEMENIREELERVSQPGVNPVEKAAVLTWALEYADAYFKTPRGSLRRAFPKDMRKIAF